MSQPVATDGQKASPRPIQEGFKQTWVTPGAVRPNSGGLRSPANPIFSNTLIPRDYLSTLGRSRTPTLESQQPGLIPVVLQEASTNPHNPLSNGHSVSSRRTGEANREEGLRPASIVITQGAIQQKGSYDNPSTSAGRSSPAPPPLLNPALSSRTLAEMGEQHDMSTRNDNSTLQSDSRPRLTSMDAALASISPPSSTRKDSTDPSLSNADIQKLITRAGTTEALVKQLLKEKNQSSSQNAQLWSLVEKQRALLLGLSKDLERMTKDRDRCKKKLKDFQDLHTLPASSSTNSQLSRDLRSTPPPLHNELTYSPVKPSTTTIPRLPSEPETPQRSADVPSHSSPIDPAMLPMPLHISQILSQSSEDTGVFGHKSSPSASSSNYDLTQGAPSPASETGERAYPVPISSHFKQPSISLTHPSPTVEQFQKSVSTSRKSPPKPLNLQQPRTDQPYPGTQSVLQRGQMSGNVDDSADRRERMPPPHQHRRQRTRDDGHEREETISQPALQQLRPMQVDNSKDSDIKDKLDNVKSQKLSPRVLYPPNDQTQQVDSQIQETSLFAPLRNPGLPSSPRPVVGNTLLTSPHTTTSAFSFPPRAPKQSIPMPPTQPPPSLPITPQETPIPKPHIDKTDKAVRLDSPTSSNLLPSIYQGFVNSSHPDLLLPPNALPLIQVRITSSRLRPPQMPSSQKHADESAVFVLSVFSRVNDHELWRLEKTPNSMSTLDGFLRTRCTNLPPLPDRKLFHGHSPALVDTRRSAVDVYFEHLLDTPMDDSAAVYICQYLSSDVLDPALLSFGDHASHHRAQGSVDTNYDNKPKKTGFLTKKGKNFGGWKSRYFVLDSPELRYFEAPGGAHLGTIKLASSQIGRQLPSEAQTDEDSDPESQYRHSFLILEPKRKDSASFLRHVLCAESDAERDEWVEVLLYYVDGSSLFKSKSVAGSTEGSIKKTSPALAQMPSHESSPTSVGSVADVTVHDQATPSKPATISGPINGTVITDASAWGNKPTVNKERDLKKRNLFHLKKASHERLPSSVSTSEDRPRTSENSTRSQPHAFLRPVFGMSLSDAVAHCAPANVDVYLPAVVYRCIEYLRAKKAANEEGIFRLSGSSVVVRNLKERFNTEGDVDLLGEGLYYDIHAVASLFKSYLRELPSTILTRELHVDFVKVLDLQDNAEKVRTFHALVHKMPTVNYTLLRSLSEFLLEVVQNSDRNKMNVKNVGIVFAPTLNIPSPVFSMFLTNFDEIFEDQITISSGRVSGATRNQVASLQPGHGFA